MADSDVTQEAKNEDQYNKVGRICLKLFGFLQRCRLNANVEPTPATLFSYSFTVNDMTDQGVAFGLQFVITSKDVEDVPDTDEGIELYCFNYVVNIGHALLVEKATRLLEHNKPSAQSKIILPH